MKLPYTLDPDDPDAPPMGLIVLQTDETIEPEFKRYFANDSCPLFVSRIPSGQQVTPHSLKAMEQNLARAAGLLPGSRQYAVVGYGCTSASSVIGSDTVARIIRQGCDTIAVTNPLAATVACAADLGISRLALLSPYIEEVNEPLRTAFADQGLSTDIFGYFGESEEASVVRISTESILDAACELGGDPSVEGVFLSCTNLRTLDAIPQISNRLGKPVLSSNQALAWHMKLLSSSENRVSHPTE